MLLIALHAEGFRAGPALQPVRVLHIRWVDHAGFAIGLPGLALCRIAQVAMGASWRVGTDKREPTALVTSGICRCVRNPTYMGLFLLFAGFSLIWPTCAAGMIVLLFCFTRGQVRCEEQRLVTTHGEAYLRYAATTKHYIPWLY